MGTEEVRGLSHAQQLSGLLALSAVTPVPRWLGRFVSGSATREVASRLGLGCEGQPQKECLLLPMQRGVR